MASNLPPGITDRMIPGNRLEDEAYDDFCTKLDGWLLAARIDLDEDQFEALADMAWDYISARL